MLSTPNNLPSNLRPINAPIQLFIHQSTDHNVVPSHQIQAMWLLHRRLFIILRPDDSLDSIFEHQIRDLIAADESAG